MREQPTAEKAGYGGAAQGSNPKQPELRQRPPADEQRGTRAARRVHRRVIDRDRNEVDQRQC